MEWIRGSGEEVSLAILRYLGAYIPRTQMTLGGLTFGWVTTLRCIKACFLLG